MIGLKFSKLPRHRKFNYSPLYYDEQKEELHSRVRAIKREMGEEEHSQDSVVENIRKAYKGKKSPERYSELPSNKFYGIKIIAIAGFLGLVVYKVLQSDFIEIIFGHL